MTVAGISYRQFRLQLSDGQHIGIYEPIEITDEMVERGASALATHRDYNPNLVPSQLWPAITRKYRNEARVVLEAALNDDDE